MGFRPRVEAEDRVDTSLSDEVLRSETDGVQGKGKPSTCF
jgi:hypothetical protein